MTDTPSTPATDQPNDAPPPPPAAEADDWRAESPRWRDRTDAADATDWQAEARRWQERANANAAAADELARVRRDAMSDQERAVAEAVDAARAEAAAEATARLGARLVDAELRAAAAGRLSPDQLDTLAANVAVDRLLRPDGDVDRGAVAKLVESLAPARPTSWPDLGQGPRGSAVPLNGDPLERDLRAKLGIR